MARQSYQEQLNTLREDVLYMGELASDRLRLGLEAMATKDETLARRVIDGDEEINDLYLQLEGDCVDLFALQQPVASDLRFVASSFKITTDLERVGDLATNLAGYALEARRDVFPEVDVQTIGDRALEALEASMTAYATDDTAVCYDIASADDEIDELCSAASGLVVRDLIETEFDAGERDPEALLTDVRRLLLTIRDLERVGDHAVNIAARTLYMVEHDDELIY
jgi:phosphate transport system protein